MEKIYELKSEDLKRICNTSDLNFKNTDELEPMEKTIIGQKRAVEAMEFGLKIKMRGYNIYMSGPAGSGKTSYAKSYVESIAKEQEVPYDWCYVYNFENESSPISLRFEPGLGKQFKDDMDELIELFMVDIPKAFSADDYEKERETIIREFEDQNEDIMKQLTEIAKEQGFNIKAAKSGIYFMPIVDGETIDEEKYEELTEEQKDEIESNSGVIQQKATEYLKKIKDLEKQTKKKLDDFEYKIGMFAVGHHISELKEKYKDYERVIKYLENVQEDILDNIEDFLEDDEEVEDNMASALPFLVKKSDDEFTNKYKVNLFINNKDTKGAPVVVDFNPTYNNLVGQVEYDNEYGNLKTDFTKIKPGLFHTANGGYIILQIHDILSNVQSWEALKRVIKTKEIKIENLRDQLGVTSISSLKPEPIPIDVKVIIVGDSHYYHLLYEYDQDFKKLFKIKADFDYEMERSSENVALLSRFIKTFCDKEKVAPFDASAVAKVIEHSSRIAEKQDKLTSQFNKIVEVLCESSTWAEIDKSDMVTADHVEKAIVKKENRLNLYEEKFDEMLDEESIMIDTDGSKIGQINGLAVLDTGAYTFGKPSRITATTYMGKSGVINIEKEADMSGSIHSKGVQVLSGFLGQKYAQKFPLALSCRLCFEQSYYGVDGDSASSTELYAILSSLADVPIKQGIAVTGSINQRGEIQPIGGVTHKIEGFFKLCNKRGLTGEQGVIIPYQNIKELTLKDEVIDAVEQGKFHIYPVKHVDEGIEILTGVEAGEVFEGGGYASHTIHGKAIKKLRDFYENIINKKISS